MRNVASSGFNELPKSLEAEQIVLATILYNNAAYAEVAGILSAEHFYEPVNARLYDLCRRTITAGQVADHLTLQRQMASDPVLRQVDGIDYLKRLAHLGGRVLDARGYAEHIVDQAGRRALVQLGEAVASMASDPLTTEAFSEQLAWTRGRLDDLTALLPVARWKHITQVVQEIADRVVSPEDPAWSTGLPSLDVALDGGIRPGAVYGFEAKFKQFKTGSLGTIALSLLRGRVPQLFIALEMGSQRIVERMIGAETGCNAVRFRSKSLPEDLVGRCVRFTHEFGDAPTYFADRPGITTDQLRALCSEAVLKLGVRVIIIDYWQRIAGCPAQKSRAEFLTEIADWVADFASREQIAVLITSQANRNGESFGSDGLAKACDWLAVIHKVDVDEPRLGLIEGIWMDIKANRDGADGTLGSEADPIFRITKKAGPALVEYGEWGKL